MKNKYFDYLNKDVVIYLKNNTKDYGKIVLVVDEGDDSPKDQYILLNNNKGYYFDEIKELKEIL